MKKEVKKEVKKEAKDDSDDDESEDEEERPKGKRKAVSKKVRASQYLHTYNETAHRQNFYFFSLTILFFSLLSLLSPFSLPALHKLSQ